MSPVSVGRAAGVATLVGLSLSALVLCAALGTMLFDDPLARSARMVVGAGLLTTLALGGVAARLIRRDDGDDRFHAGMLLATALAVALVATAIGVFSGGI
jgi:NhaP-type Na+/H+ or K+/H+ antiporter